MGDKGVKDQLSRKKETCEKFVASVNKEVLEHLSIILERIYWTAFEDGYNYRRLEESSEK